MNKFTKFQDYETLAIEQNSELLTVQLNRPDRMNALSPQLIKDLWGLFGELKADYSVRVVILTGTGRAFCAGLDVRELMENKDVPIPMGLGLDGEPEASLNDVIRRMRACPQPIIAAVNGAACGGGFALSLASDVRIVSESAKFNDAFIKMGASGCEMGVSFFLPRSVGLSNAFEIMYTGEFVLAERAVEIGLASRLTAPEELMTVCNQLANQMLATSPLGLRKTKETVNRCLGLNDLDAVLEVEECTQAVFRQDGLFEEGAAAFLNKRDPKFSN